MSEFHAYKVLEAGDTNKLCPFPSKESMYAITVTTHVSRYHYAMLMCLYVAVSLLFINICSLFFETSHSNTMSKVTNFTMCHVSSNITTVLMSSTTLFSYGWLCLCDYLSTLRRGLKHASVWRDGGI